MRDHTSGDPSEPTVAPLVVSQPDGVAVGFDGSVPDPVYTEIWRALEDEAERQQLEAEAAL